MPCEHFSVELKAVLPRRRTLREFRRHLENGRFWNRETDRAAIEQASHSIGEHAEALWVVRELKARCLFVN